VRGKPGTETERPLGDLAAMLPLPTEAFEVRRGEHTTATWLSLVRFDCDDYSVPTAFALHEVTATGAIEEVRILCGDEVVAVHPRHLDKVVLARARTSSARRDAAPRIKPVSAARGDWHLPRVGPHALHRCESRSLRPSPWHLLLGVCSECERTMRTERG
jgi:hypothetical protein